MIRVVEQTEVVIGTSIDLRRVMTIDKPVVRVS
jgi:hypothetical protein